MTASASVDELTAWAIALQQPAPEFPSTSLPILDGTLPERLRGTLYRNGPGRLGRGDHSVGHWFDGDGAILGITFADSPMATYRYVKTKGYLEEEAAGQLLYGNFGMTAPGPIWNQWRRPIKHAANTSVLPLPDRLLALWEGDAPYALELDTLKTIGCDRLDAIPDGAGYSAHPKVDPQTGEIFNFGLSVGREVKLNLYQSDRTGSVRRHRAHALNRVPLLHDFVMAGPYLVFCIPPVRMQMLPVALGLSSFSDALQWQPQHGTQILIFDRQTLDLVRRIDTDPWFQWHFSNGFVDQDGHLVLSLIRYDDFATNQYLKDIPTGDPTTPAWGRLWEIVIDPRVGRVLSHQDLVERGCEFPTVDPHAVGQSQPRTYLSIHRRDAVIAREIFGAIAQYDHPTHGLDEFALPIGYYPSEPILAPADHGEGWLLSIVLNTHDRTSEVWIFQRDRVSDGPICRLGLPQMIPPSFHGAWQPLSARSIA
jgi:carotenoid cleavage dioxygenase-like enzyme